MKVWHLSSFTSCLEISFHFLPWLWLFVGYCYFCQKLVQYIWKKSQESGYCFVGRKSSFTLTLSFKLFLTTDNIQNQKWEPFKIFSNCFQQQNILNEKKISHWLHQIRKLPRNLYSFLASIWKISWMKENWEILPVH